MKWAHLPMAGGFYDQDPYLMDQFEILFQEIDQHEKRQRERDKREQDKKSGPGGRGSTRRGRRR